MAIDRRRHHWDLVTGRDAAHIYLIDAYIGVTGSMRTTATDKSDSLAVAAAYSEGIIGYHI